MTKLRTRHMALILSVAAVAAAGCGSSSKSKSTAAPGTPATPTTSSTGTTTTPAGGFSAQLNALCTATNKLQASTVQQAGAALEKELPKYEALTPPAAQKAAYAKFLSLAKQITGAAKRGDATAVKKISAQAKGLGAKLGAPACDK